VIRLAMFDVGETLVHDGRPFPHAVAAVAAVARFETADGGRLGVCAVSDYTMPDPPTEEAIAAPEDRYRREVLAPAGLDRVFRPFEERVTLSTRAGVRKPDRRIFELAVKRSGTGAALPECLFVTEDAGHLDRCREYGITPVRFGDGPPPSFTDWADGPAVLAELVAPGRPGNRAAAMAVSLEARHGLVGFTPDRGHWLEAAGGSVRGHAQRLVQLTDPRLGPLAGVYVDLPTEVTVRLGPGGRVAGVSAPPPPADAVADAANFVSTLVKSGRVALPGQPAVGATHAVVEDDAGRRRLVRKGYAAV
jgi:hypothetical protein